MFIDHDRQYYLNDLKLLEKNKLLKNGAIVIADNVGFFGCAEYLDHVRNSGLYSHSQSYETELEYISQEDKVGHDYKDSIEVSIFKGGF